MKKILISSFLLLTLSSVALPVGSLSGQHPFPPRFSTWAPSMALGGCDACGCSASGGSMGFSSMLNSNFVGIRYFYQRYSSRDGIFANSPWVNENFNTMQLWARVPVGKRMQLSALVPFHFHDRRRAGSDERIDGLGDVTLLAMYTLYQTPSDTTAFSHKVQIGGGVKMPTGTYDIAHNAGSVNPGFQVGTGSWDYPLAVEHVVRYKAWGLNTMLNCIFKTANEERYRFGDQFNYAVTVFYMSGNEKFRMAPQAGVAGENFGTNRQYGQDIPDTSGRVLFSKFGVEAGIRKFALGANVMLPLSQNLSGGNVEAKCRWSFNLNYEL